MKSNILCQFCHSTNHPSNDCPERAKKRALTGGVDPKSFQSQQLAIEAERQLTAEDELNDFLKEIQKSKEQQDQLKSIAYEAITANANKAYDQ